MAVLSTIHLAVGIALIVACLAAFGVALVAHRHGRELPARFWTLVRVVAGILALQVVLGLILLAAGLRMPTPMHWLYPAILILGVPAALSLHPDGRLRQVLDGGGRFDAAKAEWLLLLFLALIAMRAVMTGILGF